MLLPKVKAVDEDKRPIKLVDTKGSTNQAKWKEKNLICIGCLTASAPRVSAFYSKSHDPYNILSQHWNNPIGHQEEYNKLVGTEAKKHLKGSRTATVSVKGGTLTTIPKCFREDRIACDHALSRFLGTNSRAFFMTENDDFKAFVYQISRGAYTGPDRHTIMAFIDSDVAAIKLDICASFGRAIVYHGGLPFLTIYFDGWTDTSTHHWVGICATYTEGPNELNQWTAKMQTACLGIYPLNADQYAVNFKDCVIGALGEYKLNPSHIHTCVTDNCSKEKGAATLIMELGREGGGRMCPAQQCSNHSLNLCIRHALGDTPYASKGKGGKAFDASRNNNPAMKLLAKARTVAGHFKRSAKATSLLGKHQQALVDAGSFPFDRKAASLKKQRKED